MNAMTDHPASQEASEAWQDVKAWEAGLFDASIPVYRADVVDDARAADAQQIASLLIARDSAVSDAINWQRQHEQAEQQIAALRGELTIQLERAEDAEVQFVEAETARASLEAQLTALRVQNVSDYNAWRQAALKVAEYLAKGVGAASWPTTLDDWQAWIEQQVAALQWASHQVPNWDMVSDLRQQLTALQQQDVERMKTTIAEMDDLESTLQRELEATQQELLEWRKNFSVRTSTGWQSPAEAKKFIDDEYRERVGDLEAAEAKVVSLQAEQAQWQRDTGAVVGKIAQRIEMIQNCAVRGDAPCRPCNDSLQQIRELLAALTAQQETPK